MTGCTWENHANVGTHNEVDHRVDEEQPAQPPKGGAVTRHGGHVGVAPLDPCRGSNTKSNPELGGPPETSLYRLLSLFCSRVVKLISSHRWGLPSPCTS